MFGKILVGVVALYAIATISIISYRAGIEKGRSEQDNSDAIVLRFEDMPAGESVMITKGVERYCWGCKAAVPIGGKYCPACGKEQVAR